MKNDFRTSCPDCGSLNIYTDETGQCCEECPWEESAKTHKKEQIHKMRKDKDYDVEKQ